MVGSAPHHVFSDAEYLERERATGLEHEFLDGQIHAMTRGTPEHARLIATITVALARGLDPKRCRVFSSDLEVRVGATGLTTYPDVAVIGGDLELDPTDANAVANPTILVEVLSPSTEAYDRGEKWAHYRRIPGLGAYVLVGQVPARLEVYERPPDGDYVHRIAEAGQQLPLRCIDAHLDVDELYEGRL